MNKIKAIIIGIIMLLILRIISVYSTRLALIVVVVLIVLEILSRLLIKKLKKDFQWLITPEDEVPSLDKEGMKKFFKFGYDKELGWIRKPNTSKQEIGKFGKTKYNISKNGSRRNPGNDKLAKKISCYGDSFAFCRQVNDSETWEWFLSKLTKSNVMNFAVGNYGLDQALLRLKKEYPKNKTKTVLMGVVPSTIVRVLCIWKHYNEFGNTFGFKPRFVVENKRLKLIKNIIDSEEKFKNYSKYIKDIRKYDYFYKNKFKKEMIQFPYLISILSDITRNIPLILMVSWYKWFGGRKELGGYPAPMKKIMKINLKLRYDLYKKEIGVELMNKIVMDFINYSKKNKFKPVFVWMPQKDDLLFIKSKKDNYYSKFIKNLEKKIKVIDLTKDLINRADLDDIYSDDNKYGGHYSKFGNKIVSELINKEL